MFVRSRPALALAALAVLSLTAAACGDDDYSGSTTTSAADDSSTTTTADAGGAGAATVELADSDLGQILTNDGMTLYAFMPDEGSDAPTCNDSCATTWPPLVSTDEPTAGDGVDGSILGTATRDDGDEQVTADGHPLYHFSGDSAAGDTNGQDVGGVWYVVGADGKPIDSD